MRLFIVLLLQALIFLPLTGFTSEHGQAPLTQNHTKNVVTEARKDGVVEAYGKLPLYFIENNGQVDKAVKFYERGAGHATFFTDKGVVLTLTKTDGKTEKTAKQSWPEEINGRKAATEAVTLSFVGGNEKAIIIADKKKSGRINYFVGSDKTKWRSNIPTFGAVTYKDVYKDIDIKFYGNNRQLEHDIIVHPGGDFSKVKFSYDGV